MPERMDPGLAERLVEKVEVLALQLEKMQVAEFTQLLQSPRRLIALNFLAGAARGFGIAVGFTILGAILVLVLRQLVVLNLPLIGNFIAEIVRLVEAELGR